MSSFPPGVFIVGAQKSGTSSLAKLLNQNAAVCVSSPKEPNFYTVNYGKGLDWYKTCFKQLDKVLVDASTTYTMCALSEKAAALKGGRKRQSGVPERIKRDSPDAKIIYIIRDPVDRLYSNYWHNVKYGYETLPLKAAIARDPQYIHMSEYYGQLEKYLDFFPKTNMLVVKFEDFVSNQQLIVNKCEEFLGLPVSRVNAEVKENTGSQYNRVGSYLLNNASLGKLEKYIPVYLKKKIKGFLSKEVPPLSIKEIETLRELFVEDQKKMFSEFGVGFSEYKC